MIGVTTHTKYKRIAIEKRIAYIIVPTISRIDLKINPIILPIIE